MAEELVGGTGRLVVVVIGASGAGKSALVRELHRRGVIRVHPTWTTRPPRPDEAVGSLEHRFVTEAVFGRLVEEGFFIGTAAPFGLPYRYGLPSLRLASSGPADVVVLRAQVMARSAEPALRAAVYHIEDTVERIAARLASR